MNLQEFGRKIQDEGGKQGVLGGGGKKKKNTSAMIVSLESCTYTIKLAC